MSVLAEVTTTSYFVSTDRQRLYLPARSHALAREHQHARDSAIYLAIESARLKFCIHFKRGVAGLVIQNRVEN